jgi:hypothetical protein
MEVVSASETSVNFYQTTRRNIPEDSQLHTCCLENLECHLHKNVLEGKYFLHLKAEDGGTMFLRNVGICLQVYTALQPRTPTSTTSQP